MDIEGKGGEDMGCSERRIPWRVEELGLIRDCLELTLGKIVSLDGLVSASPEILKLLERVDGLVGRLKFERIMSGKCKPGKCVVAQEYVDTKGKEFELQMGKVQTELHELYDKFRDAEKIAHILRTDGPRIAVENAIRSAPGGREVAYSYYDFANRAFVHTPAAERLLGIDPGYTEGVSLRSWFRLIKVNLGERPKIFMAMKEGVRMLHYEADAANTHGQKLFLTSSPRFYVKGARKIAIGVSILPYDPAPENREAYASRPESTDAFFSDMNDLVDNTNEAFANLVATSASS